MSQFPIFIDSTMLNDYRLCEQRWHWRYVRHLVRAKPSVHLSAGGAIAKGLEVARRAFYERGAPQADAVAEGLHALLGYYGREGNEEEVKSWQNTAAAFVFYCDNRPFATDPIQPYVHGAGKSTIEFSATLPLPTEHPETGDSLAHPETGEPLLYTGRFDMLGRHTHLQSDKAFAVDEKTTSRIDSKWAEKWALRGQFIGYCWLARQCGYDCVGAMVRGLAIHKHDFKIIEIPVDVPQWKLDQWYAGLLNTVRDMLASWRALSTRAPVKAMNDACGMYSGCDYLRLCDSQRPEMWMHPHYEERPWNPVEEEAE